MNKFEKVTFGFLVEDQEYDFNPDLLIPAPATLYLILGLGKAWNKSLSRLLTVLVLLNK